MVSELIDKYFRESNTNRDTFRFNGKTLSPSKKQTLNEVWLYNNSEIIVS